MAIQATYPIRIDSTLNEFNVNFIPRGVIVTNYSADNIAFDNTVDPVLLIPPGVQVPIVILHLVTTVRVRSATNTTGSATLTIMDSEPDTAGAPPLKQLPGTITATIPSAVTVGGTVGLDPAHNAVSDATLAALITALNALAATGNTNTGVLTGLLPKNTAAFTLTSGVAFTQAIANAITGFSLILAVSDGFLTISYTTGGRTFFLVQGFPFISSGILPTIEKEYIAAIPAGSTVSVLVAQSASTPPGTGVLKW